MKQLLSLIQAVFLSFAVFSSHSILYGMGQHIIFVNNPPGLAKVERAYSSSTGLLTYVKDVVAAEVFYNITIATIKSSILCLYHRIFPLRWLQNLSIGIGSFIIAYSVAFIFIDVFQCVPLSTLWDAKTQGTCVDLDAAIISSGVLNVLTDFIILCLPLKPLLRLQVSPVKKRQLVVTFTIGGL